MSKRRRVRAKVSRETDSQSQQQAPEEPKANEQEPEQNHEPKPDPEEPKPIVEAIANPEATLKPRSGQYVYLVFDGEAYWRVTGEEVALGWLHEPLSSAFFIYYTKQREQGRGWRIAHKLTGKTVTTEPLPTVTEAVAAARRLLPYSPAMEAELKALAAKEPPAPYWLLSDSKKALQTQKPRQQQ